MPVSLGSHPRHLEELRIGGGYGSAPDGGADFDRAGNIAASGSLDLGGPAAFESDVTVAGDFAVTGVDTTWSAYLPASLGMPDPALPCGPVTPVSWRNFHVATPTLAFDPNNPEAAYFQFRLPPAYDGRPLTFTIEWSAQAGTGGDVRWGVLPISFSNGSNFVVTGTTTFVNTTLGTLETLHITEISSTPLDCASETLNTVRIIRLSNDGADTFDADALLLGIGISL
ncbi:MAG: hypothetical protein KF886_00915 [Candidatus Hydrogenedentes bacterium]|nr:hypothetical protein [Candidatus Hydrogenedentota bacterium]